MVVTPEVQIFLLAMTPIGEIRVSLPTALIVYNLDWKIAYLISVAGNLIPVIILLRFLGPISNWLSKNFNIFQRFFFWFFKKTRKQYNYKMERYSYPALVAFVALPLPLTGGWSASIIAFLLGIPFKKAFGLITLGIMIAGLIVLMITQIGIAIEKYFGWQILVGLLLTIGFIWLIYKMYNINNKKQKI